MRRLERNRKVWAYTQERKTNRELAAPNACDRVQVSDVTQIPKQPLQIFLGTKGKHTYRRKGRFDVNVNPNREYQ